MYEFDLEAQLTFEDKDGSCLLRWARSKSNYLVSSYNSQIELGVLSTSFF